VIVNAEKLEATIDTQPKRERDGRTGLPSNVQRPL